MCEESVTYHIIIMYTDFMANIKIREIKTIIQNKAD